MIHSLVRKKIIKLIPYQSARSFMCTGNIWLNANEYPLSYNYLLKCNDLNRYPDCQSKDIIENYANYAGIKIEQILISRGIDESIELLMRVFCEPNKDAIIFCPPTYGMYSISAKIFSIKYKAVQTNLNWQLDLSTIKKRLDNVKLVYICNPNNPTGNILCPHDIEKLLKMTFKRALVIIDEAYIDFCIENSSIYLLNKYEHLVILRTLSKSFALAGLRCGFTLANVEIIKLLLKIIAPYPISTPVVNIAKYALSIKNINKMKNEIKNININRDFLLSELNKSSYVDKVFPSFANYLLVKFYSANKIFKVLCNEGIIVRDLSKQFRLKNCLRITIGTLAECKNFIAILNKLNSN